MFRLISYRLAPLALFLSLAATSPAAAQGLGLGLELGGDDGAGVNLNIGGESATGLDVNVGGDGDSDRGLGLDLNLGGGSGGRLDFDLGEGADTLALGQKQASEAVRRGRALPLEDILLRARLLTDGDIIDARLIAVQDVLLYEVKVLGKAGDVSELYFYARSGLPVGN
ncbi:hypothetical protein PRN20_02625 [Devosia sp. ZB163]|uniref:PepSY domain-containing protein n=1 Tax=Devosia sp. ZB163 TaxID=3025938 RepID=UPI002360957F|nr:hypothetical protein [Devosia sp. ZB163]MDC9822617.1 hypothetical protein [Devosia sp. ZB163]